jgi:hypothetical protein
MSHGKGESRDAIVRKSIASHAALASAGESLR